MILMLLCCLIRCVLLTNFIFFFNDTATTEIYTLSLHDALPISPSRCTGSCAHRAVRAAAPCTPAWDYPSRRCTGASRSEEHTSELQSQSNLVCRLLLEKKNNSIDGRHDGVLRCMSGNTSS